MPYSGRSPIVPQRRDRYSHSIADLMLRQGDIAGQRAYDQNAILGQSIAQAGAQLGQGLGQFFQRREQQQSQEAMAQRHGRMVGIVRRLPEMQPEEFIAQMIDNYGDPDVGLKVAEGVLGARKGVMDLAAAEQALQAGDLKLARQKQEQAVESSAYVYRWIDALGGPSETPETMEAMDTFANLLNAAQRDELGEMQWTPQMVAERWPAIQKVYAQAPETVKLGKNERLVTKGGEEIVGAQTDPLEERERLARIEKLEAERDRLRAEPEGPEPSLADVDKLAQRWKTATAPTRDLQSQVQRMEAGMDAARKGDLAAGSQAVLITFQKILDPDSVVRESEYERSSAGQSAFNRAQGILERLAKGGAGVPVSELEKFARLARDIIDKQTSSYLDAEKERLEKLSRAFNVNPELVFEDVDYTPDKPQTRGATPPKPESKADMYPEGTVVQNAEGERFIMRAGNWERY